MFCRQCSNETPSEAQIGEVTWPMCGDACVAAFQAARADSVLLAVWDSTGRRSELWLRGSHVHAICNSPQHFNTMNFALGDLRPGDVDILNNLLAQMLAADSFYRSPTHFDTLTRALRWK